MKNTLVFGSILVAASATAFACGDSTGDGGSGGATTQASTAPATGSGSTATKAASSSSGGQTSGTTTTGTTTTATTGTTTAASTSSGGMCVPPGEPCQDCIFMNCCDQYTACAADVACQTCMDCLQVDGTACLINGMCNLQDANQGAFIQCAQQCQADCT